MPVETPVRKALVQGDHQAVARDLGHDRGGGDGGGESVAADQGLVAHGAGAQREPVDEDRTVDRAKQGESTVQGQQVADVQPASVDRGRRTRHDGEAPGARDDVGEDFGAPPPRELLGIVERVEDGVVGRAPGGVVEDHRRRHERTRKTTATGFVGAGHAAAAAASEVVREARVHGRHSRRARSERAEASERPVHEEGLADEVAGRHGPPHAAVIAVEPVVAPIMK